MSLVTVLRSPSTSESTSLGTDSDVDEDQEDSSLNRSRASSFEGFFASKGAAYALPDGDFARQATNKHGGEMQLHLQAMVNLLRDEDVLRLVIKLESQSPNRIRYLTIVSAFGPDEEEQSIVMGVDWTDKATIGLVVPVYRDTTIKLDGDGGFHMISSGRQHIFKPISVQTMWTALQWIHKCSDNARKNNYFYPNGSSHAWADYYYRKISSDRVCVNEWEQMDDIESKRPESPIGTSTEKELIMKLIRHKLKEVMTRVDLEDVTCRQIRMMLEEETQMELKEYRSFIDEEMIIILGQMDSASHIFDHVYLGSEWNASNLEELKENGVGYILNITREIDNFFPGTFLYYNIRVYDLDETELLHHWDNTYRFIQRAKDAGSKVLVHCRMGISRSASTVIAYGMKEYGWSLGETMKYVKGKRNVVQPNAGFWKQLITYEGILNSSKQRYNRLFRHSSFCTEEGDLPKSSGAVKKRREKSPSSGKQLPEGLDTVDNIPLENEDIKSSDDSLEELRVLQETLEDTEDLCLPEDTSLESGNADSMLATSSPIVPCPEATVETSGEVFEETNSVPLSSSASEISVVEKFSLQRVRSVPALPSDDKKGQESDDESTGNFRRSRSLRERNTKKLQNLRIVTKGRSASDENLKEFERKKREILGYEETEARDAQETQNFEKESRSSLPRDLDGVLESGFVKRHSRKFEEGVCYAPELDENVDLTKTEEMEVECLPEENKEEEINREEQVEDESVPSEEPEPGVVRKHKEGYELKHRESLKRRAMLQRDGSGEGKSAKREEDEIEAVSDTDTDIKLPQAIEGLEDEVRGVSVEALVKKVNEDMKKEVSVRRISASKKEQELRAFVQKAGEQMREALTSGEDEDKSVLDPIDSEQVGEASNTGSMKRKTRVLVLEEDVEEPSPGDCQLMESSSERNQPDASEGDTKSPTANAELVKPSVTENVSAGVELTEKSSIDGAEASELLETLQDKEEGQETEDVPPKGLVKRHTLLIEGKLQPLEQELEKADCEKENELAVELEAPLSPSKGERKSEATDKENAEDTNKHEETVKQVTPERVATSEVSQDNKDAGSDNDTESVLQKGLVKRHTLLIEGKLQPLDQELEKNTEKENKQECELSPGDQVVSPPSPKGQTNRPSSHVEQTETDVVQGPENNNPGKAETSELPEDSKNIDSDKDTEDLPQKGVVKRHTLLLEGRLQPLEQELAKNAENEDRRDTEPVVNQDSETKICTDSEKVKVIDEPNESDVVELAESSVANSEETRELTEDMKDVGSEKDAESVEKGLVKRHTLLIEGRLQPLDQELEIKDVQKEDGKEDEITFDNEASLLSSYEQEQLRYQIERTDDSTAEQCEEENEDSENVSGLVKREKLRIEERLQTTVVDPKQEAEDSMVCNVSSASGAVEELEELCPEADTKEQEDDGLEKVMGEEELSEVAVDTSSVVRVKAHTQHLEGILRVKQDVEKVKRQTSKEDVSKSKDEGPKFFIVPRSSSDESIDDNTTENLHEDKMNVLSDSAVNIALFKAQENLDAEKESVELENKIDWDVANVKQRTQIFEDMRPKESKSNPLRRQESMPKMVRVDEIPPMRRRSVSDVTSTVSSGSSREVGYTIVFKNRVMGSSSASSLPRDWSPLEIRKRQEDKGELLTKEVFLPEINKKDKLKRNTSVEIIKRHDSDNDNESCVNVKQTIQVLDSKNQKNISNC